MAAHIPPNTSDNEVETAFGINNDETLNNRLGILKDLMEYSIDEEEKEAIPEKAVQEAGRGEKGKDIKVRGRTITTTITTITSTTTQVR